MVGIVETISVSDYQVVIQRRSRQKNMNLSVKPDGVVRVSCNRRRSEREITEFVRACKNFIERRRLELARLEELYPPRKFVSGEKFLWKGERLPLDVVWSWNRRPRVELSGSGIEMLAPLSSGPDERLKSLRLFYKREAKRYLAARVDFWARITGLRPVSLTVRGQRTLWGSCTSEGALNLNWKLMCAPDDVIDYVVVHELAHLREQNHSKRFWAIVAEYFADYKIHREWLKSHQQEIARQFHQ